MLKRLLIVSLLTVLISACTSQIATPATKTEDVQPIVSNTLPSILTAASTSTALVTSNQSTPTLAMTDTAISACPGAPAPHVTVGQQVTVASADLDKLKLRSEPKISPDTVLMELDTSTRLNIVGGFVCVHSDETGTSYWFWKVEVLPLGVTGWVAEGDAQHYFIAVSTELQSLTAIAFSNTVEASPCANALKPRVMRGEQVSVITEDIDKLKLRSEPKTSPDTIKMELNKATQLKIIDGPICVFSQDAGAYYWFWMVAVLPNGEVGWVAEGDSIRYFIE